MRARHGREDPPAIAVDGTLARLEPQHAREEAEDLGQEDFIPDLTKIHSAGKHLLGLINDVLDLSKIEAGKMELFLETVEVRQLLDDVASTVRPLCQKNGNKIETICPDDVASSHTDITKVRQALLNLLSNASKFTKNGTVTLTAARQKKNGKDWITMSVQDTGIGMTEEHMGKLFQEFSQADPSTTRRFGGTGLGLAISRRLCNHMGGDISVESAPGEGTCFTVRLPIHSDSRDDSTSRRLQPTRVGTTEARGNTVLVIDDDPTAREMMLRYLVREGFDVVTAQDGDEGLRVAREIVPSVITLDVVMPEKDGWDVLRALKSERELADIPVVMLTVIDEKNKGYALGASDYVIKPVNRERLLSILENYRAPDSTNRVLGVEDDPDIQRDPGHSETDSHD